MTLVRHQSHWLARLCMKAPRWLIPNIESARVGNDYSYVRIHFRKVKP